VSRLVYTDTGAFIALLYPRDRWHDVVSRHFRRLRSAGDRLVTSEPVISETVTRLRYDAGVGAVSSFRGVLVAGAADGSLTVRESDDDLRHAALGIVEQYDDLRLSYADAVGAVVARDRHVDGVFALDAEFRILGLTVEPDLRR
jgi:predicted nucleic acid-binding protein